MSDNVVAGGFRPDLERLANEILGSARSCDGLRTVMARIRTRYGVEVLHDAVWRAAHALRREVMRVADRHKNLEDTAFNELGGEAALYLVSAMDEAASGLLDEEGNAFLLCHRDFSWMRPQEEVDAVFPAAVDDAELKGREER